MSNLSTSAGCFKLVCVCGQAYVIATTGRELLCFACHKCGRECLVNWAAEKEDMRTE
jgi:hypothetical protein